MSYVAIADQHAHLHDPQTFITKYVWSQDHKVIAIQYTITALFIGLIGLVLSDLMRLQLQKEMLMSFVIHDLKNPVGSMDLLAQALVRDRALPEDARDTAQHIRQAAGPDKPVRLLGIVDFDPAGDIIAESFRAQLEASGLQVASLQTLIHPSRYSAAELEISILMR